MTKKKLDKLISELKVGDKIYRSFYTYNLVGLLFEEPESDVTTITETWPDKYGFTIKTEPDWQNRVFEFPVQYTAVNEVRVKENSSFWYFKIVVLLTEKEYPKRRKLVLAKIGKLIEDEYNRIKLIKDTFNSVD